MKTKEDGRVPENRLMKPLTSQDGITGASRWTNGLQFGFHDPDVICSQFRSDGTSITSMISSKRPASSSLSCPYLLTLGYQLPRVTCPVQDSHIEDNTGLQAAASNEMGFSAQDPERDCILTITQMNLRETLPVELPDKTSAQTNHLIAIFVGHLKPENPTQLHCIPDQLIENKCFLFEAAKCWDLVNVAVYN